MSALEYSEYQTLVEQRRAVLRRDIPLFVRSSEPFTWEVGSGHGHFLAAYARAHPSQTCIGVDISPERVARATRKQERAQLPRLRFVLADAEDFLASMPANARISEVFILFPDPWPKRRHHKNRLIRAEFLDRLASFAVPRAPVYFRTDHEPYFLEASGVFGSHARWTITGAKDLPFSEPTVFERRAPRHFTLVAERA